LIAEEFWQQGDLERVRLNKPSQPLMDRRVVNQDFLTDREKVILKIIQKLILSFF